MLSNCMHVVGKRCRDGACLYVDLCFHASSLPCLHTFWHAIPTSFYFLNVLYFLAACFTGHSFWAYLMTVEQIGSSFCALQNCSILSLLAGNLLYEHFDESLDIFVIHTFNQFDRSTGKCANTSLGCE